MNRILDKINSPQDLRELHLTNQEELELAKEIREELINSVSKTGGHLASNLGVVELTIALHTALDTPKDKIVWDVGHQTYVHKMLTGRREEMANLRQYNGLAGFPKRSESPYDTFDVGHSSTSISAALGMARARDIRGEDYACVAVIGDGSLTGGMALEALNDAGTSGTNIIVILNDNEMSIERNEGGVATTLAKMRTRRSYRNSNRRIRNSIAKIPYIGEPSIRFVHRMKYAIKQMLIKNMMFEDIGYKYLGPVDGNDIDTMVSILRNAKDLEGPVLIHCVTKKGKGYKPAEDNPNKFHGVSAFDIKTGNSIAKKKTDYSAVFGETLIKIATANKNVVAITAAMTSGTGLSEFEKKFPKRFFDVEIAEQHALTLAAGMATSGLVPVVPIYSSFMQRGYDQVVHDICMQKLHVVMCLDRAGLVGADGETHQGIFDLAFLEVVPNLTIMAPKDFNELSVMMEYAINEFDGPIAIRYPRGGEGDKKYAFDHDLSLNDLRHKQAEVLSEGQDLSIIAIGNMVDRALEVSDKLKADGISASVINARFLKPFDIKTAKAIVAKHKLIATIEDGTLNGGLYDVVMRMVNEEDLDAHVCGFGFDDVYVPQGSVNELQKANGLDVESIVEAIKAKL